MTARHFILATVFRITADGTFSAAFSFDDTNGGQPYTGLTLSTDGSFYGTTFYGGAYNRGTVFKVTTNGALTALISFDGTKCYLRRWRVRCWCRVQGHS